MTLQEILVYNYKNDYGTIDNSQLDQSSLYMWISYINELYISAQSMDDSKEWFSVSELDKLTETNQCYEILQKMIEMIGLVNGHLLIRQANMNIRLVSFIKHKIKDQEMAVLQTKKKHILFRLRLEYYLARQIIEQLSKTARMIDDEMEDRRMIRNIKSSRRQKRLNKPIKNEDCFNVNNTPSVVEVKFTDLLIRNNAYTCVNGHDTTDVDIIIDVMTSMGNIIWERMLAGYCKECNVYYILDSDYKRIREKGVLLCQVTVSNADNIQKGLLNYSKLKPESILYQCGYNVSQADDLSTEQRHEILKRTIDSKLYSKESLIQFLDWLISRNEKVTRNNMVTALQKWKMDREFVFKY